MPSSRKETGSTRARGLIETLVVIALILIIPLFFAIKTRATWQGVQNISAASIRPTENAPQNSTAVKPNQPPACRFPLSPVNATGSTSREYSFSEPQVVLTHPDNLYDVIEWLPDNEQVLIVQELRAHANPIKQSIEIYNIRTGISEKYALRDQTSEPPSWQPGINAVVYPATIILGTDQPNHRYNSTRQVWVSHGNADNAQLIADNLLQPYIAIRPGGSEMIYFSDKQISKRDKSLRNLPSVPFDLDQWDYAPTKNHSLPVFYKMAWQPGTPLLFLYSDGDTGGGYTFILDSSNGKVCTLDLGGWATRAHWSPDGRYLALVRFQGKRPTEASDLAVLDTITGSLSVMQVTPKEIVARLYVSDLAWAPDNRHLLAIGSALSPEDESQGTTTGLYLVDIVSSQSNRVLPAYSFSADSSRSSNLAWSSDGSSLLVRCPTRQDERLCFISVKTTEQ